MASLKKLEDEINKIKERNKRVEAEKAWETSWTRKILILFLTYLVIVLFFVFAGLPKPFVNATVPTAAYFLSTLSISAFRKIWMRYCNRK